MNAEEPPPGLRTPLLRAAWPTLFEISREGFDPLGIFEKLYPLKLIPDLILLRCLSGDLEVRVAGDVVKEHFPELKREALLSSLEQTGFVKWLSVNSEVAAAGHLIRVEEYFTTKWKKRLFEAIFFPLGGDAGKLVLPREVLVVMARPSDPPPY